MPRSIECVHRIECTHKNQYSSPRGNEPNSIFGVPKISWASHWGRLEYCPKPAVCGGLATFRLFPIRLCNVRTVYVRTSVMYVQKTSASIIFRNHRHLWKYNSNTWKRFKVTWASQGQWRLQTFCVSPSFTGSTDCVVTQGNKVQWIAGAACWIFVLRVA